MRDRRTYSFSFMQIVKSTCIEFNVLIAKANQLPHNEIELEFSANFTQITAFLQTLDNSYKKFLSLKPPEENNVLPTT